MEHGSKVVDIAVLYQRLLKMVLYFSVTPGDTADPKIKTPSKTNKKKGMIALVVIIVMGKIYTKNEGFTNSHHVSG